MDQIFTLIGKKKHYSIGETFFWSVMKIENKFITGVILQRTVNNR